MSLIDDVTQQLAAKLGGPSSGLQVSKALPTFSDLQAEIEGLTNKIQSLQQPASTQDKPFGLGSGMTTPSSSPFSTMPFFVRMLKNQLAAKQKVLNSLLHPTGNSGVPPAPEGPAILGPRIDIPKVGFSDLTITPTR